MDAIIKRSAVNADNNIRRNASAPNVSANRTANNMADSRAVPNSPNGVDAAATAQTNPGPDRAQERLDAQRRREMQLENVVSRSEDGDTVQVDPRTQDRIDRAAEGAVTMREDTAEAARAAARELAAEAEAKARAAREARQEQIREERMQQMQQDSQEQPITSFAGYTASQIEQLYAQGRISRQDYESEMASRQEKLDSQLANNSQLATEAARLNGTRTQAQLDAKAISTAFADNAGDPRAAAARLDAMQTVQDRQQVQRDQQTQQSIISNNEGRRTWDYQLQA